MTDRLHFRLQAWALCALAAMLALLTASPARASLVAPMTVEEITAVSDEVVHGRVLESTSRFYKGMIVSEHDVEVVESLKGDRPAGATMRLATPGGNVGPIGAVAPGAPTFRPGDEVVLFLAKPDTNTRARGADLSYLDMESPLIQSPQVIGGFQGHFRVVRPATPEQVAADKELPASARPMRAPGDVAIIHRDNPGRPVTLAAAPTLDEFKAQVRDAASPQRARTMREIPLVGRFAVAPERRESKALRAFDPLPVFATDQRVPGDDATAHFQAQRRELVRAQLREAMRALREREQATSTKQPVQPAREDK